MKSLLIDSNQKAFSYLSGMDGLRSIQFPPLSEWLTQDAIISDFIISQLDKQEEMDLIIIPFSVTENYLEFSGIRLAHHIRLSSKFFLKTILFVGDLSPLAIYRLTPLSNILSCKGIYFSGTSKSTIEELLKTSNFIELADINDYLQRVVICPPANYDSHHSVDNELTLLRWSEFLKCDQKIPEVRSNLQTGLYFKYIKKTRPPVDPVDPGNIYLIEGKAKILLIDDESEKGWNLFYKSFFELSPTILFESLPFINKSSKRAQIIVEAKRKVEQFNPDIVLLDLRLCDEDFTLNQKPDNLTGYIILEEIKKINQGIQVIITTASNKVWNYEALFKIGANGYITKIGDSDVKKDIKNLRDRIQSGIKKAQFLKKVDIKFSQILDLVNKSAALASEYKTTIEENLEISYVLLENHFKTIRYLNYSYLQLFLIAESFIKQDNVFEEGDNSFVIHDEKRYPVLQPEDGIERKNGLISAITFNGGHYSIGRGKYDKKTIDTNFKMSAVLLFKFGCTTSGEHNWTTIYSARNDVAHSNGRLVTMEEYFLLIDYLQYILDDRNFAPVSIDQALPEFSYEKKIEQLKRAKGWK